MQRIKTTFNGTREQAVALVESIKRLQAQKERAKRLKTWFARGASMRAAREAVIFNN